jgi:hypothetical protein
MIGKADGSHKQFERARDTRRLLAAPGVRARPQDAAGTGETVRVWCNDMSFDRKSRGRAEGYFYRSVRINGRAVKQYVGTGPAAELAAKLLDDRRRERAALVAEREKYNAALAVIDDLHKWLVILLTSELLLRGYHARKSEWRPRSRKSRPSPQPPRAA